MSKNQRRQQAAKSVYTSGRNEKFNEAMREKGRSSAASRHGSVKDYRRKPKHVNKGWD